MMAKNDTLASQALRVLGFGYRELAKFNGKIEDVDQSLIFVGMVGMIDPPKPEVENSIREAVELGIKTGHDYWRSSVNCTLHCKANWNL